MPRKAAKTEKPALLFLERSVRGAKVQHVPELRAALNPREFFTDTQTQHSSTLDSWVSCCSLFDLVVSFTALLGWGLSATVLRGYFVYLFHFEQLNFF